MKSEFTHTKIQRLKKSLLHCRHTGEEIVFADITVKKYDRTATTKTVRKMIRSIHLVDIVPFHPAQCK